MTTIQSLHGGILTNEHAASSHGQPVYVYDGMAYGPRDLIDMGLFGGERAYEHALRPLHAGEILDDDQQAILAGWHRLFDLTS